MARRSGHGHGKTTLDDAAKKYERAIQDARKYDRYAKGVAAFLGVSVDTVKASNPAKHWNEFSISEAKDKWKSDLYFAYTGQFLSSSSS